MPRAFAASLDRIVVSVHMFPSNAAARSTRTGTPHRSTGTILAGAS